jgi:hypothetical protein
MRRQERRDLRNSLSDRIRYDKTIDALVSIAKGERDGDDTQNEESEVPDSEGDQQEDDS